MTDMAEAHWADYASKAAMEDLRRAIVSFLDAEAAALRCRPLTQGMLASAAKALGEDCASVVRVWD